jgi:hypothetical protein
LWRGDFETGSFSQWGCGVQEKLSGRATVASSPLRQGRYAARFEVRSGDNNVAGSGTGERTEACATQAQSDGFEGHENWWAWSTYFDPSFSPSTSAWNYFTQWHHTGPTGQANLAFASSGNLITFRVCNGSDPSHPTCKTTTIDSSRQNGRWYDFVVHVKWSSNSSIGLVEVWENAKQVIPLTHTATLYPSQGSYFKQGYYRSATTNTAITYEDGARVGTSYDAVVADFPAGTWPLTLGGSSAPTVSLSASTTSVPAGSTAKLSWSSANASTCTASGGWSGSQPTSGYFTAPAINTATTYNLTCTGSGGSTTATTTINVTAASPTSYTATSSITNGAVLSGTVAWLVKTSGTAHYVDYYINNTKIGTVTQDGTSFTYNLNTTLYPNTTDGGFQVYSSTGALLYRSPSILFTVSSPTTPPAVSTNAWTGQYYDNVDLTGLKITRVDPQINFNWPSGTSPDATIASTSYSAIWKGSYNFDAATYNFTAIADDGVRVYIDGKLVLDKWVDEYPTTYNFSVTATAGAHTIQVNYYNNNGGGVANLSWSKQVALPVGTGLNGSYYDGINFNTLKFSRLDPTLNFNWGEGTPSSQLGNDTYSIRWAGRILAKTSETYTFTTQSDDGIRVWINGILVINNWTTHSATYNSGTINLSQGQLYSIKVEYYENTGNATAKLLWSTPTISQQVIPTANLFKS